MWFLKTCTKKYTKKTGLLTAVLDTCPFLLVNEQQRTGTGSVLGNGDLPICRLENRSEGASPAPSGDDRCSVPCSACRALMDEVEYDVTKARQKKTKVGSFRINPDGTQERRKVVEKKLCASV